MTFRSIDPLAGMYWHDDDTDDYERFCPVCEICGERITDDIFRRIGSDCYHDGCIETVQTDSYVEGVRYGY